MLIKFATVQILFLAVNAVFTLKSAAVNHLVFAVMILVVLYFENK